MMVTKGLAGQPVPNRIYAIGDVHGHSERLRGLHALIQQDLRARPVARAAVVHLGDYIDRGPDSAGCIDLLAAVPIEGVETVNLMGNHERMMLDAMEHPRQAALWLENGGAAALQSWGIDPHTPPESWREQLPAAHLRFLNNLHLLHAVGNFVFVHAGVRPGIRLAKQSPGDLLWIRKEFLEWTGTMLPDAPDLKIVHGHTPSLEPEIRHNRIGIDTNAGRGGKLTCAALNTDSVYFLQV